MGTRIELREKLKDICPNLYFQPPSSEKLIYPCIIYHRVGGQALHADNGVYAFKFAYEIMVVDRDPDSEIVERLTKFMSGLPFTYNSHYTKNNLNHDVFTLYY